MAQLEGSWHQAMATWGNEYFGCIWMQIRDVTGSKGSLDAHWTTLKTFWSPFDKGSRSTTYDISASYYGVIDYSLSMRFDPTLYRIVDTDYSTYILAYHCEQEWLDFYTREYFDIYTPDGTITDALQATLTAKITEIMSGRSFEIS